MYFIGQHRISLMPAILGSRFNHTIYVNVPGWTQDPAGDDPKTLGQGPSSDPMDHV